MNRVSNLPVPESGSGHPRLLWLGGPFSESDVHSYRAISPAANRWNTRLIEELRRLGAEILELRHRPEPAWPRGPGRVGTFSRTAPPETSTTLGYPNLPVIRDMYLRIRYRNATERALDAFRPSVVVTYNPYWYYLLAAKTAQTAGVPWLCIFADRQRIGFRDLTSEASKRCDAAVYLSWHDFSVSSHPTKLHLDGGIDASTTWPPPGGPRVAMYSGAINKFGGVDLLIDASRKLAPESEVWITGKGMTPKLRHALASEPSRVKYFGFVGRETLEDLSRAATVFVNPRPDDADSRSNFPSKLLEYLSYGKPVVSTITPGISPDYKGLLQVVEAENPLALAEAIECAFEVADDRSFRMRAKRFVADRSWPRQAQRFLRLTLMLHGR